MDPASLALSVATVLETALKLVELLHDIKEGGKQRIRLTAEISSLWLVLENVKSQLDELSSSSSQVPMTYLKTLGLTNGPLNQCAELLTTLYEKCKPKGGAGRVLQSLKWSFDKDEVDRYLLVIHRLQTSIHLAYAQTSLTVLNDVVVNTSATRQVLEGQELKQLLDWLSPIDFEAQQSQAFKSWCPGTVEWTLKLDSYSMFKDGKNPYLWCPAAPGCGKTTFCSLVIQDLRSLAASSEDMNVLGVYLNSRTTNQDDSLLQEILGSLLKQLCLSGCGPDDELRNAFHSATKSNSVLGFEDAASHLKRLMAPMRRMFLVIDGIDELLPHKRRIELIEHVKALYPTLSIFMAGRPYPELAKLCAPLSHVCDVCDDDRATGFYHCEDHLRGGWDVCASCHSNGNSHCPVETHAPLRYLTSTLVIWFRPCLEDIELYSRKRIEDDGLLEGLFRSKDSLKQQVIRKIVSESDNK